uniref:U1-theraphotoxin-Pc1a n=1 Tax=Psalmopoeus cambridgei TaxID=179874 RepID=NTA_PSACA|nr:RecName: Full=U1-theraphotoxin-Pc1a; Short=U1-TRTX-Pc1a; AltName: Full=Psalmopeotoxin I; AltName: Full=Psalmopeotoxin-1; AltName: Full=Psalmopoeus cambridgei Falciparum killer 1; Short=PcFK1; Flags: Precursor [Psalmopoeus cambridgei]
MMRVLIVTAVFTFFLVLTSSGHDEDNEQRNILEGMFLDRAIETPKGLEEKRACGILHDNCVYVPAQNPCCRGLQCRYGKCLVQVGR